jgi:hypothetical protein
MSLEAGCPRCPKPVVASDVGSGVAWLCAEHGPVHPLWRPVEASYDAFADHLRASIDFPTYLPWPVSPGWSVTDFGVVGDSPDRPLATMTCSSGASAVDGPVDLLVVTEEPGTGLGARCAGLIGDGPGSDVGAGPPLVRVQVESKTVPLWVVSTSTADREFDRSVVAGEAEGRWLWIVVRPAAAVLLLRDDWILRDISGLGAPLLELPFGGPTPAW